MLELIIVQNQVYVINSPDFGWLLRRSLCIDRENHNLKRTLSPITQKRCIQRDRHRYAQRLLEICLQVMHRTLAQRGRSHPTISHPVTRARCIAHLECMGVNLRVFCFWKPGCQFRQEAHHIAASPLLGFTEHLSGVGTRAPAHIHAGWQCGMERPGFPGSSSGRKTNG